jgi:translocation and assembly module TamB
MTQTPGQEQTPPPRRRKWRRFVVPIGLLAVTGWGLWRVDKFVREELTPLVQETLTKQLKRPVQVGKLERYSLTSLRLGKSSIPATATDPDHASVEAIEVGFDFWGVVASRKLKLEITLIDPTAYLEEEKPGVWIETEVEPEKEEPFIKTELAKLHLKNVQAELSPAPKPKQKRTSIKLQNINGTAEIFDRNTRFIYELQGESVREGNFQLKGETRNVKKVGLETNLEARGQRFLVSEIDRLIRLPINLEAGRVDGNVEIQLRPKQKIPDFKGTATFAEVDASLPQVPYRITNAKGELRLGDRKIKLDKASAIFGEKIPILAEGTLDVDKGYDLNTRVPVVSVTDFQQVFNLKFPVTVTGKMTADVKISGALEKPILSGSTRNIDAIVADRIPAKEVSADFKLDAKALQLAITNVLVKPAAGGEVTGGGILELKQPQSIAMDFRAVGIPGDAIGKLYNQGNPLPIEVGQIRATAKVSGTPTQPLTQIQWQAPDATYASTGEIAIAGGVIRLEKTIAQVEGGTALIQGTIQDGQVGLDIKTQDIQMKRFAPQLRGIFSGDFKLVGALADLSPEAMRLTGEARLSEGISMIENPITADIAWDGRQINVKNASAIGLTASGAIFANLKKKPEITGFDLDVQTTGLLLTKLPVSLPEFAQLDGSADFQGKLTGSPTAPNVKGNVTVKELVVNGFAFATLGGAMNLQAGKGFDLNIAGNGDRIALATDGQYQPLFAEVDRGDFQVRGRSQGKLFDVTLTNVPLDELRETRTEATVLALVKQAEQQLGRSIGGSKLAGRISGNVDLDLRRGILETGQVTIAQAGVGNLRAETIDADLQGVNLANQTLRGGEVTIANAKLDNIFTVKTAKATFGAVNLATQSVNGGEVEIADASFNNLFTAKTVKATFGSVNLATRSVNGGEVAIGGLEAGLLKARNIALKLSPGNLSQGQTGQITLDQVAYGQLVAKSLDTPFTIRNNRLEVKQSTLAVSIFDSPYPDRRKEIGVSNYIVKKAILDWSGDPKVDTEVEIVNGQIQDFLQIAQIFELADLTKGIPALHEGKATDLDVTKVGLPDTRYPNASLRQQLQRLAEIDQLIRQTASARQELILPELTDLRGKFKGVVSLSGSMKTGFKSAFDLEAKNVEWRPYPSFPEIAEVNETVADRDGKSDQKRKVQRIQRTENRVLIAEEVILQGEIDNNILSLSPLQIKSGETTIKLSSVRIGGDDLGGQLNVTNLPIESIQEFVPIPLAIAGQPLSLTGKINGSATLGGGKTNPLLFGSLSLNDGEINNNALSSVTANFNYTDGRLNFSNNAKAGERNPLTIIGNIPIPFKTALIQAPDSKESGEVTVRVQDEGIEFFNLLGQPIAFEKVKGTANLDIKNIRYNPETQKWSLPTVLGEVALETANVRSTALPEQLSDVKGRIVFDLNGIRVDQLTGQLSFRGARRGQIVADGTLTLFPRPNSESPNAAIPAKYDSCRPDLATATKTVATTLEEGIKPLTIDLQRLAVNRKGLYQGSVNGRVVIGGSAIDPRIGGDVCLTDGLVLLADAPTTGGAASDQQQPFELEGLKLTLGRNIRVGRAPILNFVADGRLVVNGTLSNLQPEGTINLLAGQVNLFTTQFVLVRGYKNRATFRKGGGLDPELDVRMLASVPEVTRTRVPTSNINSEINDAPAIASNLGALQTVRIQARVSGPASKLSDNLELTSSPGRSPTEIVALLGGGFVNTLGRGDSPLGIANLAGSALLTNVQGTIGNALGLSEFRLFPTVVTDESSQDSTLGLAAEAGIDILRKGDGSPVLSASVLRVLTSANQPTQFGLRYRINDQLLLRGSTDLSGENRAVLEFETRF